MGETWENLELAHIVKGTSLVAQMVKRLPAMRDTQVRSLGREDPLEKEMATYSGTLVENPMDGGVWWATAHGLAESDFTFTFVI